MMPLRYLVTAFEGGRAVTYSVVDADQLRTCMNNAFRDWPRVVLAVAPIGADIVYSSLADFVDGFPEDQSK